LVLGRQKIRYYNRVKRSVRNLRGRLRPVLLFFIPFALVLTVLSGIFLRSSFFALPRQRPDVWGLKSGG
jgi:hypothetical protein